MSREKAETLALTGLRHYEAKTLLYLFNHGKAYSRDIEREMDLRQPEVSSAMSDFIKKGWVEKKPVDAQGKGRPTMLYTLKKEKQHIIIELKKKIADDVKQKTELYKELDAL